MERLSDEPSLRELAGVLSDDETEEFRAAIDDSYEAHDREIESLIESI